MRCKDKIGSTLRLAHLGRPADWMRPQRGSTGPDFQLPRTLSLGADKDFRRAFVGLGKRNHPMGPIYSTHLTQLLAPAGNCFPQPKASSARAHQGSRKVRRDLLPFGARQGCPSKSLCLCTYCTSYLIYLTSPGYSTLHGRSPRSPKWEAIPRPIEAWISTKYKAYSTE